MKFNIFERILHWKKLNNYLALSDYSPYTNDRFVEIEGSSSVLLQAALTFFVYTIPENILSCLALFFLFKILQKYKISQYFRKFYFLKPILFQSLIEGNVCYFVYVCLGHLSVSFSFKFEDKACLGLTVFFLWIILMFSFCFYVLVGHFLREKACYFIFCFYRCNAGYFYLTIKNLSRNLLRGTIFFFFHEYF